MDRGQAGTAGQYPIDTNGMFAMRPFTIPMFSPCQCDWMLQCPKSLTMFYHHVVGFWWAILYIYVSFISRFVSYPFTKPFTGWWFGTVVFFFQILRRIIPTDIVQRGRYTTNQFTMTGIFMGQDQSAAGQGSAGMPTLDVGDEVAATLRYPSVNS